MNFGDVNVLSVCQSWEYFNFMQMSGYQLAWKLSDTVFSRQNEDKWINLTIFECQPFLTQTVPYIYKCVCVCVCVIYIYMSMVWCTLLCSSIFLLSSPEYYRKLISCQIRMISYFYHQCIAVVIRGLRDCIWSRTCGVLVTVCVVVLDTQTGPSSGFWGHDKMGSLN